MAAMASSLKREPVRAASPKRKAPGGASLSSGSPITAVALARKKKAQSLITDGTGKDREMGKVNKEAHMIDKDVLLPGTIFEGGTPEFMRGHLFHYQVLG